MITLKMSMIIVSCSDQLQIAKHDYYSSSVLDPYHSDNRKRDLKKMKSGRRESAMDTDEWVEEVQSLLRKQCLSNTYVSAKEYPNNQ